MKRIFQFEAIATLVGTIIGAGILGIPYVISMAGFWTGTLVLAVVALVMILMKLMYGEATLRTYGNHQVLGYTEIYMGRVIKYLMSFILIIYIYGTLLAYFIGQGEIIEAITGIPAYWSSIGFFAIFSFFIYIGLGIIRRAELIMTGMIVAVMVIIALLSKGSIDPSNIVGFDLSSVAIPYGVILFALSGIVAVPEVRQILKRKEGYMRKAIIFGCLIPPILYFLFTALVISISGVSITEIATVGLGEVLGWKMILVANIFAFFTIATSFLTMGFAQMSIFQYDYKMPKMFAWLAMVAVPLILFFLGARDFIRVIELLGSFGIGFTGSVYVLTYFMARKKGKRKPEYRIPIWLGNIGGVLIVIMFILGMVYTISTLL